MSGPEGNLVWSHAPNPISQTEVNGSSSDKPMSSKEKEDVNLGEAKDRPTNEHFSRYPQRQCRKPKYLDDYVTEPNLSNISKCAVDYCYRVSDVPNCYGQAISSSESFRRCKAMSEEMQALVDNDTFELTPLPEGLEANLPKELWTYAVKASAYIRNRCYSRRTGKTAYEMFTGKKPNLSNMHRFGTACHAYVKNKKNLDSRSEQGIFVGYDNQSPAFSFIFL